jgi:integrase
MAVGRKANGFTFHMTRNTAATDLRAGGMDEADAMKITGHQTSHVFKHYDLGNVDALRDRLTRARKKAANIARLGDVRSQRAPRTAGGGSCTAAAQQPVAGTDAAV